MKCQCMSYAVTEAGNRYGADKVVVKCTIHNWTMDYPGSLEEMCPIGRIEEARDQALASIALALSLAE